MVIQISSPLAFGQEISPKDIERFLACGENTSITLWSMQQPGALDCLKRDGRLTGNPDFAFAPNAIGKKGAYIWMQQQMEAKLPDYRRELPIWALLSRPNDTTRAGDQLIRMEVPKSRMLVSFHKPWDKLLKIMDYLECNNGIWPDRWLLLDCPCPYISANEEDRQQELLDGNVDGARRWDWNEQVCRASWEKMFDLTQAQRADFLWKPILLQAMLPAIFLSDVKDVSAIPVR